MLCKISKMKLLKKKTVIKKSERSNVIQFDDMGYPLRLIIDTKGNQVWVDTLEESGDVVLVWK